MGSLIQLVLGLFGLGDRSKIASLVMGYLLGSKGGGTGGLGALVEQFRNKGLGDVMSSWVGTGPNKPITPDQVKQGVGVDKMAELAKQAGLPLDTLAEKLAKYLPGIIDKATPGGKLPGA